METELEIETETVAVTLTEIVTEKQRRAENPHI